MKLLPSLFTVGNLICGVLSIVYTYNGNYIVATVLIFVSHFLDIVDGRVARLTRTTSSFGVEFDSLADFLSFGVAAGFLTYTIFLAMIGNAGLILFIFYVVCTALRLARFNVSSDKTYFMGLPAPASGGFLSALILGYQLYLKDANYVFKGQTFLFSIVPAIVFILSILMISRIRYTSFKFFSFRPVSYRFLIIYVVLILLIFLYPQNIIFLLYLSYILHGIAGIFLRAIKK